MSDSINEKISSFLDDECQLDKSLMDSLADDRAAKAKWARYNLIGDVLNDRDHHRVDSNWFNELHDKINNEPAILVPRKIRTFTHKAMKQVAGFAVAATVAMVAILSVQQTQVAKTNDVTNVASVTNQFQSASSDIKPVTLRLNKAKERRLSGYLVNHYEYSVSGKMQGVMPYMRIVSVTPAEKIVHEK